MLNNIVVQLVRYYVCHTRPDIAFFVHKVAQFMQSPCEAHWVGVKRILSYLTGTLDYGLWLSMHQGQLQIKAFTYVDWGSDPDDRRSISGYCVYLGNHLLSWSSRKQRSVSRSKSKVEYRSLVDTTSEVLWVKAILEDMNVELSQPPVIWCNNTSIVAMATDPAKVKHVDLDVHFVREKVMDKQLIVNYVPAHYQIADVLTKPLITTQFQEFCQKLNVVSLQRLQLHKNRVVSATGIVSWSYEFNTRTNWWDSSRTAGSSSGLNNSFGWATEMADIKTTAAARSSMDSVSSVLGSSVLQAMDWNQAFALHFSNNAPFWNPSSASMADHVKPGVFPSLQPQFPTGTFDEKPKKKSGNESTSKRPRNETPSTMPAFKVRKEKMEDRTTALQQLASSFGKTNTASVLSEAIEYIKFLHEQVSALSIPYMENNEAAIQYQQDPEKSNDPEGNLRSRELCLVPVSSAFPLTHDSPVDFWTPTFGATLR
ncbi:bHLH123 protein [Hibiscus syriacus]|uniref:BHLH123 protein n=1 Tax=Hibiscus syriacus TaxID=106335 RepID=A0A6A2YP02_HIBSY|nr:bHLH123 protein [Hibiscus syriacus]